jgi:S-adenosylmethionine synthetase
MPAPIHYAHAMLRRLSRRARSGAEPRLGPDAKSQLSLRYSARKPVEVSNLVLSTQHLDEDMTSADVREMVEPYVAKCCRGMAHARHGLARQPDGTVRDRRARTGTRA